jgi:perosamine synthetase
MRKINFGTPMIGDEEKFAVLEVMAGTQFVHGPKAKQFEADFSQYVGGGYTLSVASCTAGLHLAYLYLGIGHGDEVIVPAQTHVATAHSVEYTGAKPVFVDVDLLTGNICLESIESAITPQTKAISVVHYLGLPVDMDKIKSIALKHELFIVEDAALALGAHYKGVHVGLLGDIASFSFYPVKHITTAEGGMLLTKHQHIAEKILRLKAFGYDKMVGERIVPGLYDVDLLGYNYRMNEIQAAIGVEQLKKVDFFLAQRAKNAKVMRELLQNVPELTCLAPGDKDFVHANYCVVVILDQSISSKRFEIIEKLKEFGIGTSIYYPGPVPHLKYYRDKYDLDKIPFPNAKRISDHSIALSVGPHLTEDDMIYTVSALKTVIGGLN